MIKSTNNVIRAEQSLQQTCVPVTFLYASSSLVFCSQAGPRHPPPPLFSSLSSSLHFRKRAFHKIVYHSYSWSTFWSLPQHPFLQHIPQESISPLHMPY